MTGGRRLYRLFPILAFAAIGSALLMVSMGNRPTVHEGYLDRPLPDFAQAPLPGNARGLSAQDLHGQVALVNVFASWCTVCRAEHPMLMQLADAGEVPIYGLNWKEAGGAGKLFLERHGDPFVATGEDLDGTLGAKLDVTGVPETYLIDAEGRIRYRHIGAITEEVWQDVLQPLIVRLRAQS